MGSVGRGFHRRRLNRYLSLVDDEGFITLIATVCALQDGDSRFQGIVTGYPNNALDVDVGDPSYIPRWPLETLANELMVVPKAFHLPRGRNRQVRHDHYATVRTIYNTLLKLENSEEGSELKRHSVFNELSRLWQRQVGWQRGNDNLLSIYRSLRIYGTGLPAEHFESSYGISVDSFFKLGFALYSEIKNNLVSRIMIDPRPIGETVESLQTTISRLSVPIDLARTLAKNRRAQFKAPTAYKPSVFREFPIIRFEDRLRSPIPDLILERITSGLYYDVVSGGDSVWNHIGRNFENYCVELLELAETGWEITKEHRYGTKKRGYKTPDILIKEDGCVKVIVECKSKYMSIQDRYLNISEIDSSVGYNEIAKAVFQIWRLRAHSRRKISGAPELCADVASVVLTHDAWLEMAEPIVEKVYAIANRLADNEGDIEPNDRSPVAFCHIGELEYALQVATSNAVFNAIKSISIGERRGWLLSTAVARKEQEDDTAHPFTSRMSDVLPWWDTYGPKG